MPLTADQAIALQRQHGLTVRLAADGWHAETRKGTSLHRDGKPSPEEAIEAAAAALRATDAREQQTRASRIVAALERGRYSIRPRDVAGLVFDAFRPDNTPIASVRGRESFVQAVIDMEALLGP